MNHQRGFTLGSLFFLLALLGFAAYVAARVVPSYADYMIIRKVMRNIVETPDVQHMNDNQIRQRFDKEMSLNNVRVISSGDLVIEQIPEGVRLSASYSDKQPFAGPVNLCMDYLPEASSK
ncbi:MAG TPA: DUF4845 domain-containing protein [Thiobacillaceae bacterium]|nr:DUF4845 domain-containing protein [Thiobacillaceae bacterium]HNA81360.1 DUF4845 domain-containing protein [Thiobacillaceae bacterium]HNF87793.1 DUF4845 domain-containing protein [Thiobacillaceae bacterium]HNH90221.1 DUF4845 domain-containing protein [Thiobacillaceae bacterium]HNI06607.1 DUF4845 domain-containing protein [Thiobacillaceae bacterium]